MAIDTENKRRSTMAVLPVPDGTIAQADRQQVAWIYAGILVTTSIVPLIDLEDIEIVGPRLGSVVVTCPYLDSVNLAGPRLDSVQVAQ